MENNDDDQGEVQEASGTSSWWGMDYSSMLNKAVSTVSNVTNNAAELAKQKVSYF